MSVSLDDYMADCRRLLSAQLPGFFERETIPPTLREAMLYSLTAGGKRIRPILLFATLDALGHEREAGLSVAVALEMIHTYSLIHDDLPAMDNDDLRRGRLTNHKVYGEGTAILAGDGLLTAAFQIVAEESTIAPDMRVRLIAMLAAAAGPAGMVGGQEDDLEAEQQSLTLDALQSVHSRKTGKLICFPVEAAALLSQATVDQSAALLRYAECLGLAFQIGDDVLDVAGRQDEIGKPIGSDAVNHKNTYVSLLGLAGATDALKRQIDRAIAALQSIGLERSMLARLATYLLERAN
ncbi:MAG: polyprenyl synthetase family protein [Sporolactobacillus sp.]